MTRQTDNLSPSLIRAYNRAAKYHFKEETHICEFNFTIINRLSEIEQNGIKFDLEICENTIKLRLVDFYFYKLKKLLNLN
jgi:hypothetical protein